MVPLAVLGDPARILVASAAIGVCAILGLGIAIVGRQEMSVHNLLLKGVGITLVALALRFGMSLVQDGGTYDIFYAYQVVGNQLRLGGDIFTGASNGLSNYPPLIYWQWASAAAMVPTGNPHLFAFIVRLPYWICDAAVAPVLLALIKGPWRVRAAWLYALNPITIAVCTLHGQFDVMPALALLLAVAWLGTRPRVAAYALGVGVALKTWPGYFLPVFLGWLKHGRWPFVLRVAAVPIVVFAVYAVFHPDHIVHGILAVLLYVPHRQGFGTSRFFPELWGSAIVPFTNVVLLALVCWIAVRCSKRDDIPLADAVALAIVLVLGLSASISDQYLVWPFGLLLFAGRLRMAAILALVLTPATLTVVLHVNGNPAELPTWLFLPGTVALWGSAAILWRQTRLELPTLPFTRGRVVSEPAAATASVLSDSRTWITSSTAPDSVSRDALSPRPQENDDPDGA